jgi:multicomponent Na+:H+ antiporter subunit F
MSLPFLVIAVFVAVLMAIALYRVVVGPTAFDRLIAAGLIGTNGILLLIIVGFIYQRVDMFIDLAIVYALLNFVGTIATGKYLERKREGHIS